MKTTIKIIHGDSEHKLRDIPNESVHIIVTSPPYDKLREYRGNHTWNFEAIAHEMYRVLVPGGVVCWDVMDSVIDGQETLTSSKQKIFFVEGAGFNLHDTMIWDKPISGMPDKTRYFQTFEYVFVLSKGGQPRVFHPIHDRKNIWFGKTAFGQNSKRKPNGDIVKLPQRGLYSEHGMRGNVWYGNTRSQEEPCKPLKHHAMMPKWLVKDLLRSWSDEGDTVLDCFGGSGTTGWVARSMGRNSILIEKDIVSVRMMRSYAKNLQPELV